MTVHRVLHGVLSTIRRCGEVPDAAVLVVRHTAGQARRRTGGPGEPAPAGGAARPGGQRRHPGRHVPYDRPARRNSLRHKEPLGPHQPRPSRRAASSTSHTPGASSRTAAGDLSDLSEALLDASPRTGCVNEELTRVYVYSGNGRIILYRYGKSMAACR